MATKLYLYPMNEDPSRCKLLGVLPADDVPAGIVEAHRVIERGVVGLVEVINTDPTDTNPRGEPHMVWSRRAYDVLTREETQHALALLDA